MEKIEHINLPILGAICGDILGSQYELKGHRTKCLNLDLCQDGDRFTDDTVCTVAITQALQEKLDVAQCLKYWCRRYSEVGYGHAFKQWIKSDSLSPYNSWGNGSAMRVSAAGAFATTLNEALELAERSAIVTHNHPMAIKGAQAVASAIWLALHGASKEDIKKYVEGSFGYNLARDYNEVQNSYSFDSSCQGSVPESIICFLVGSDYEDVIRHAIALGGDADTMAAIAGSIASAYFKQIPVHIISHCMHILPDEIKSVIGL